MSKFSSSNNKQTKRVDALPLLSSSSLFQDPNEKKASYTDSPIPLNVSSHYISKVQAHQAASIPTYL